MNEQQRAAVEATGEVFVSAGAGTGKTAVLVERFVRAVCDRGLDIDSILVITYTRRAAGELRTRIRAAFGRARAVTTSRASSTARGSRPSTASACGCSSPIRSPQGSIRASASSTMRRARCCEAKRSGRRSTSSAPTTTRTGCVCSQRTAPTACAGCSPASTRRFARPGASSPSRSAHAATSPSARKSCERLPGVSSTMLPRPTTSARLRHSSSRYSSATRGPTG